MKWSLGYHLVVSSSCVSWVPDSLGDQLGLGTTSAYLSQQCLEKGCKTSHFCVGFQTEMRLKDGRGGNTGGEIERRFYPVVTGETLYRVHCMGGGLYIFFRCTFYCCVLYNSWLLRGKFHYTCVLKYLIIGL